MIWDAHIHSSFSSDSGTEPEKQILSAIEKGLPGICFTDHCDLDYPLDSTLFQLDFSSYFSALKALAHKFSNRIDLTIGVEMGLQPHLKEQIENILSAYPLDFVIGSSHIVNRREPALSSFYQGRSQQDAYREYFETASRNLDIFDNFDVYGHLDYVIRYGPEKDKGYSYHAFRDILDEILIKIIKKGKGIEVNTGGFRCGLDHPNPRKDIIRRYRELGGEIITIGSDGHSPDMIALRFEEIPDLLRACGFEYYTVFKNRKPEFWKLP